MAWATYFIHINLYLVIFYSFYFLVLENETFFSLNRTYLLGSAFFAFAIPIFKANWFKDFFMVEQVQSNWANAHVIVMQGFASPVTKDNSWVVGDYLTYTYLVVVILLILKFIIKLFIMGKLFRSTNTLEAFSFFKKIKINTTLPYQTQIKKHELTHANQLHSADIIFFEMICIINWFNPISFLYKKSVRQIHEFIADKEAVKLCDSKSDYAMLLFSKNFGLNPNQLTNNFFNQSLLKKRIKMLQKAKSRKTAILKYGLSAPLFFLAIILSSAKISENETMFNIAETIKAKQDISDIIMPDKVNDTTKNPDKVFSSVEVLPSFPGGSENLLIFLGRYLKFPLKAKEANIQGRVFAKFIVEKDGSLTNIKVERGIGYGCDEEAIRVLKSSPKWNPGMQNGEKVRVSYTIPIFFQLNKLPAPPPNQPPIYIDAENKALFIINGVEYKGDKDELYKDLNKEDIKSVRAMKTESAIKKYGIKGKNGAIEINTNGKFKE